MNVSALHSFLADAAVRPFRFGSFDCVRFVIDALYVGWGRDYRHILEYEDRRTAVARLRRSGGLRQAFSEHLEYVPASALTVGDIAYFRDPKTVGLIMPDYIAVKAARTIWRLPLATMQTGWRTHG